MFNSYYWIKPSCEGHNNNAHIVRQLQRQLITNSWSKDFWLAYTIHHTYCNYHPRDWHNLICIRVHPSRQQLTINYVKTQIYLAIINLCGCLCNQTTKKTITQHESLLWWTCSKCQCQLLSCITFKCLCYFQLSCPHSAQNILH